MPASSLQLTVQERDDFFSAHLPHRLTLLRAFRDRQNWGGNWQGTGDIYRCLKDSALISIRLFLQAMGLKGKYDVTQQDYRLERRNPSPRFLDDVYIDQLGGQLVDPATIKIDDQRLLAGIYCRAEKELAHLTTHDEAKFNTSNALIEGINLVEGLLRLNLYDKVGRQLPPVTTG
jgi:hypothetical protein